MGNQDVEMRARCSKALKDRVTAYRARLALRGDVQSESDVVRDAIIEFLEARESAEPAGALALNDRPAARAGAIVKAEKDGLKRGGAKSK